MQTLKHRVKHPSSCKLSPCITIMYLTPSSSVVDVRVTPSWAVGEEVRVTPVLGQCRYATLPVLLGLWPLFRCRGETNSFVMLIYNVYICVWECSYRLQPPTLPSERVSQINKNQIKHEEAWSSISFSSLASLRGASVSSARREGSGHARLIIQRKTSYTLKHLKG